MASLKFKNTNRIVLEILALCLFLAFEIVWGQVSVDGRLSLLKSRLQKHGVPFHTIQLPYLNNALLFMQTPRSATEIRAEQEEQEREEEEEMSKSNRSSDTNSGGPFEKVFQEKILLWKLEDDDSDAHERDEESVSGKNLLDYLSVPKVFDSKIHSGPFVFGRGITVDIDVVSRGTWLSLSSQQGRLLKLGIKSPSALSLNLLFDKFWLPEGAELYVHGPTSMLGAYTAAVNNKKHMKFATTPLPGSFIVIEYFEPAHVTKLPILHVSSIVHGFRGLSSLYHDQDMGEPDSSDETRASDTMYPGNEPDSISFRGEALERPRQSAGPVKAGNCNINAPACKESKPWINQANSVAIVMTSNGQKFCTGALINNALRDGRQLFLTANHCVNEFNSDFRYNILGFNYQSNECPNNQVEWPLTQTTQGLTLLGT